MVHDSPGTPRSTNRLAGEASPYLLQHAHNPVDWWPWGPEAIEEARRRDVPIFLSIGYSTCYWCHVMERESFESERIAAMMNERFVCVKVDREQRPDLDELYMAATQIMTGHGGWPMSVFLEPRTLRPFYCGTYWPAEAREGMASMPTFPKVLEVMSQLWRDQRKDVQEQAESLAQAVELHVASKAAPVPLGVETVQAAAGALLRMFDRQNGGFGRAPKFPQPVYLDLLLDVRERAGDDATRAAIDQAIRHTLDRMAIGGLRDQVGGGFHRYSVDATWTVPHFEKMLYDNAMLAEIYARAAALYADSFYRDVSRSTVAYVLREMAADETSPDPASPERERRVPSANPHDPTSTTTPSNHTAPPEDPLAHARGSSSRGSSPTAFFTAQDAEVDHREGLNYLWTPEQVRAALPPEDAEFAITIYGLSRGPNFQDPHHPGDPPANVLRLDARPEELAQRLGMTPEDLGSRLARINAALYAQRQKRKQPHLDDKTILSWNALMVRSLAACAAADPNPPDAATYLEAAYSVARSLLRTMAAPDGTLLRIARHGRAQTPAVLEDYATLTRALVTLARTRPGAVAAARSGHANVQDASSTPTESPLIDPAWALSDSRRLIAQAESLFGDGEGGYFDTRADATDLFVRSRATYDGAMPAGPTLMALALAELAMHTREPRDLDRAVAAVRSISAPIAENPVGSAVGTRALLTLLREPALTAGRLGYDATGSISTQGAGPDPATVAPGAAGSTAPDALDFTPVEVFAPDERLTVRPGQPAQLRLLVRIAPGFHVIAADPGSDATDLGLVPFRVDVVDADAAGSATGARPTPALAAYADYPAGSRFQPSEAAPATSVYEGEFELLVVLDRAAGARPPARPILVVTFQACTETECLKPQRLELDVAIDV